MEQIIYESNDTNKQYPNISLMERFEQMAAQYPDKIALESESGTRTYRELNNRANAIAERLRKDGIGRNDIVAVCIERSISMIEAVYGIHKAGAAYLPIDVEFPKQRVEYILSDAKPKALLLCDKKKKELYETIQVDIIVLEDICPESVSQNPGIRNEGEDIAYVIYTSGTSGKPKGVMNCHSALQNRIDWMDDAYPIVENDTVLQKTTYTFDVSVWEIFWWGIKGAKLSLLKPGGEKEPEEICEAIQKNNITTMHFVPSMFSIFLEYVKETPEWLDKLCSLKQIFTSGEALQAEHVKKFFQLFGKNGVKLVNLYGPTEAAIDVTYYECQKEQEIIPIGKPIHNIRIHIVKDGVECGIGIPGELCIAGAGLAKGYINNEELTQEKFVLNPFDGGKMYRSGDLARWMPDGNIEYLGRMDDQVKIHGIRIELGEIENAIKEIKGIRQAIVIAREDKSGTKELYAYIIAETKLDMLKIRKELGTKLPECMIPAYMMQIDEAPITANGKLDKRALPDITPESNMVYVAPENNLQDELITFFKDVLKVDKIGIDDDFFRLGGNSLRAIYLTNNVRNVLRKKIRVEEIYRYPTVRKLSSLVKSKETIKGKNGLLHTKDKNRYLMSNAQRNIYLAQIQNPFELSYNIVECYKIEGKFDRKRLVSAVNEIVRKNEILRTTFYNEQDKLYQCIHDDVKIDIEYEKNIKSDIKTIFKNYAKPFDLGNAPLFRMKIVTVDSASYMLFDIHHIISDGTGNELFIKMLLDEYHRKAVDPEFQFKDFSEWEKVQDYSVQKKYWNEELADLPDRLNLPTDRMRTKVKSYNGGSISTKIGKELKKKIRSFCSIHNCSEFMMLLSVFMILLHKYSTQNDILVGTPMSGRTKRETENMLGMFVNTIILRGKPEAKKKYIDFLNEIRKTTFNAFDNQNYPFENLVMDLNEKTDVAFNHLFDVMFIMQNIDKVKEKYTEFYLNHINMSEVVSKFDITLEILDEHDEYDVICEYSYDLYNKDTAERLLSHYFELLKQILENPYSEIRELNVISKEEKDKILYTFNANSTCIINHKGIVERFSEIVERYPECTAVMEDEACITYSELDKKSSVLALKLKKCGVGRKEFIPLILEKGISSIVGIMGILKTGAAFVPIDRTLPLERIRYIINDCNAKIVLCEECGEEINALLKDMKVSCLQVDIFQGMKDVDNLDNWDSYNTEDLAYLIYTSGTTGKPKGVMIGQRGLLYLCEAFIEKFHMKPNKRILQHTNISFDPFIEEVFPALLSGATIVVTPEEAKENYRVLCNYMYEKNVDIADFCPLVLAGLLPYLERKHNVKQIICGGDNLSAYLKNAILKLDIELFNNYGPSEITVDATCYQCTEDIRNIIGTPFADKKIYIMNEMQLCGIGVPGEIYIESEGVAKGYLGDVKSDAFLISPFGEGRMYKTGDIGRWLPDGNIEYLGRKDNQVKINGIRIELLEIEEVIKDIDGVSDVVITVEKNKEDDVIVAYIVLERNEVGLSLIREEAGKILPGYMVPAYFFQIEVVPLTENGKVDYRKLSKGFIPTEGNELYKPRSKKEKEMLDIFSKILNIEHIGIYDNFFRLGGNSLKAIYLVNEIEGAFGKRLLVKDIYNNSTIAELSKLLNDNKVYESIPVIQGDKIEMSSPQKSIYISNQIDLQGLFYNMSRCYQINGELPLVDLQEAFNKVVQNNEILRTVFKVEDDKFWQIILEKIDTKVICIKDDKNDIRELVKNLKRPFDLQNGPLVRLYYIENQQKKYVFIEMHHIISDMTTFELFVNQVFSLCNRKEVTNSTIQYKDFSEWSNQKDDLVARKYWIEKLEDYPRNVELISDYPRKKIRDMHGNSLEWWIDCEQYTRVKNWAEDHNCSTYMILLSAYVVLLKKYSRQNDIIVGSPMSGRIHKDIEHVLGMFVNTVPIRCYVSDEKRCIELIEEIKTNMLDIYEYQDYPLEKMVEDIGYRSQQERSPLFDFCFIVQNTNKYDDSYDMYNFEQIHIKEDWCGYDMVLEIDEEEDRCRIVIEYKVSLFKEETMRIFGEQYLILLKNIIENPNAKIGDITEVGVDDLKKLEKEGESIIDTCEQKSINELLSIQAKKFPNKIALCDKSNKITYEKMYDRVNSIAYCLYKKGVIRNEFVAIISDKSIETITCIFAILRSGGAYVPIDNEFPEDRILYMVEDCKPKIILYKNLSDELKEKLISSGYELIDMLHDFDRLPETKELPDSNKPDDLAYLIYTSGTTGKPKGVMIEHEGVIRLSNYYKLHTDIRDNDIMLQFSNITFDAMTAELSMSILLGNALAIIDNDTQKSASLLTEYIKEQKITMAVLPPELVSFIDLSTMRLLITAGSELSVEQYRKLEKTYPCLQYRNEYGPTEATVCATIWNKGKFGGRKLPIGKAMAGKSVYILNGNNICGENIPGEICIGGKGLAKGYLNNEELTKQKFSNNPFGKGRIYRTGDLGRRLKDGNIEYLGRIDHQVKFNGFRIEMGEIEENIRMIDGVVDTVVTLKKNGNGRVICAYILEEDGRDMDFTAIQYILSEKLPRYMIPGYYKTIDKIPLNKNGKVDYEKLPEVEFAQNLNYNYVEPRTEMERVLIEEAEEILNVERIGVFDEYYMLGGDSIHAIQLSTRLRKKGYKLEVVSVLQHNVFAEIANTMEVIKDEKNVKILELEQSEIVAINSFLNNL